MNAPATGSPDRHGEPFETVQARRLVALYATVGFVDFGTLWWVQETLWKEVLSSGYDQGSNRLGHPGLSTLRAPAAGIWERVPMLHGTSGDRGPVVVRGLSPGDGDEYPTSFGHLLGSSVPLAEFDPRIARAASLESADRILPTRASREQARVRRNDHKPCLTPPERRDLENWVASLRRQ